MVNYKKPLGLYSGQLTPIKTNDNIGHYLSPLYCDYRQHNMIINSYTEAFVNTEMGNMTLALHENPQEGELIKFIDLKRNFENNRLTIDALEYQIDGESTKVCTVSGSIVYCYFIDQETGWITLTEELNRSDRRSVREYQISKSEDGDRSGLAVYQTGVSNTVDLAISTSHETMPVLGFIISDMNSSVLVQTDSIDTVRVQLDDQSSSPQPGQKVFLSDEMEGYVMNIEPDVGIKQQLGIIKNVISDRYIIINFFPHPENWESLCEIPASFGDFDIVDVDVGDGFQIYVDDGGHAWGEGVNSYGQLGVEDTNDRNSPERINYPCPVRNISCGFYHSLIVDMYYDIYVMGRNNHKQLGTLHDRSYTAYPTQLIVTR